MASVGWQDGQRERGKYVTAERVAELTGGDSWAHGLLHSLL